MIKPGFGHEDERKKSGRSRLERIDAELLTPIVGKSLGDDRVRVTGWDHSIVKGDGAFDTRLVARLSGTAVAGKEKRSWSLYLKVPNPTHTHFNEWNREPFQREVLMYRSGILEDLPGGIVVPRCIEITEFPDDEPWMWLEEAKGTPSVEWPLERFGLMAHHFGLMQGAYLAGRSLPDEAWIDTGTIFRARLRNGDRRIPAILEKMREHPLTKRFFASRLGRSLEGLWSDRERFYRELENGPCSLCHGDYCYGNVFDAPGLDGGRCTVVIDWQYAGRRPIGSDLAGFIADSSIMPVHRKAAEPEEFTRLMLDGYLTGLAESGWKGDPQRARFACLTFLALPWTFILIGGLNGGVLSREPGEADPGELERKVKKYEQNQAFLLDLGEEARHLMEVGFRE